MPQLKERDEIVRRGQALYDESIRPRVEADHRGEFVVINVETGEYEVDESDLAVSQRANRRFGAAPQLMLRIGYSAAYFLGNHGLRSE